MSLFPTAVLLLLCVQELVEAKKNYVVRAAARPGWPVNDSSSVFSFARAVRNELCNLEKYLLHVCLVLIEIFLGSN